MIVVSGKKQMQTKFWLPKPFNFTSWKKSQQKLLNIGYVHRALIRFPSSGNSLQLFNVHCTCAFSRKSLLQRSLTNTIEFSVDSSPFSSSWLCFWTSVAAKLSEFIVLWTLCVESTLCRLSSQAQQSPLACIEVSSSGAVFIVFRISLWLPFSTAFSRSYLPLWRPLEIHWLSSARLSLSIDT